MNDSEMVSIGSAEAVFRDVRLPVGLLVRQVTLSTGSASMLRDPFQLRMAEPGTIEARVDEASLAEFLNHRRPGGLKDFQVVLADGKITVEASVKVVFDVRAKAYCHLRIVGGLQLHVELDSVEFLGVGAKNLVEQQLAQVNPVLDVREFPLAIRITSVEIERGWIVLRGSASPT